MTNKIFLISISLFISTLSLGQKDTSILKREPRTLKIAVDNDGFYQDELKEAPFVFQNKAVVIYPGDSIYVEIEQSDGVIKGMRAVKENRDPKITLRIRFYQESENKIHKFMMLHVTNPFPYELSYKPKMYLLKYKKWVDTNALPIIAGKSAYETWPDIIIILALENWKFKIK